jgi:hypothetical protein
MNNLPPEWKLIDEWDNNSIFENSDISFCVNITWTENSEFPFAIDYIQMKGTFTIIGIENGAYSTHAFSKNEAIAKAIEMMSFIDKFALKQTL